MYMGVVSQQMIPILGCFLKPGTHSSVFYSQFFSRCFEEKGIFVDVGERFLILIFGCTETFSARYALKIKEFEKKEVVMTIPTTNCGHLFHRGHKN